MLKRGKKRQWEGTYEDQRNVGIDINSLVFHSFIHVFSKYYELGTLVAKDK